MSPAFAYRAVDSGGGRVRGRAEATDPEALARRLEQRGLLLLKAETAGPAYGAAGFRLGFGRKREVLELTRALAALLPAGLPLAPALGAASNVVTGEVASSLQQVREQVERGDSLAAALSQHQDLFSPLYIGLVRAGERSGDLAGAFTRLAGQLEREEELRSRLLSASIYPMILATLGGLAVVVLLIFVIPRFAELLEGAGAALPRSTTIVLGISTTIRRFWPVLIALPLLGAFAAAWAWGSDEGRRLGTKVMLRLPLLRAFKRLALAAQFARLTGTLLGGGAPLLSALNDTTESLSDPVARDETVRIRARVREGVSLNDAIAEGALFPRLLAQLTAVGVESGRLQEFLLKAAEIFEGKTERAMQRLVTVAEPAMIVVFGTVVALVALALLQAIYSVNAGVF